MMVFPCQVCQTSLSAKEEEVGLLVRCPQCKTVFRVPGPKSQEPVAAALAAADALEASVPGTAGFPPPGFQSNTLLGGLGSTQGSRFRSSSRRFGFNCGYCSSRLEATDAMAAQEGQCPTCGNNITIPILDRYGRLIDPKTRQIIKQDPHPVHAYAAAGQRAPKIIRHDDGKQNIQCPRCSAMNPINANNCKSCGMPFTMEGTTLEAGAGNGFCVAALVLGIIGLPGSCAVIPGVLAIIFGVIGLNKVQKSGSNNGKGMAIWGIVLGGIGCIIAVIYYGKMYY
jgi:DNA-directed RNA polymerase subunit RPC12/RpoP